MNLVAETAALLSLVATGMVEDRAAVQVTTVSGRGDSIVFVLEVAQKDKGKVVGKQGRMAQSLRLILTSIGKRNGRNFFLELPEELQAVSAAA